MVFRSGFSIDFFVRIADELSLSSFHPYSTTHSTPMVRIGLVAGCYERTLHGFDIVTGPNGTSSLQASFLMPAHQGSIKSVAGAGPWVASGSTDEVISIMNVDQMAQTMTLHHHDGDINSLGFHSDKFLFSASVDGRVCVFRTSDWTLLATLKGHKYDHFDACFL
jgi:protein MAK11